MLLLHPKLIPLPENTGCSDIFWALSTQNYPKSPVQESKGRVYSSSAADEIKPPCASGSDGESRVRGRSRVTLTLSILMLRRMKRREPRME